MAVPPPPRRPAHPVLLRAFFTLLLLALAGCDEGVVEPPPDPSAANVAALIAEDGAFSTLDAALEQVGLASVLSGGGPYTVFAPTDEAFYLLGARSAGVLLDGASDALLAEVLRAHVVPGRFSAEDLRDLAAEGGTLTSLDGVALPVAVEADGAVVVGGAAVEEADREADNGLVHAVAGVIHFHLDTAERLAVLPYTDAFERALENADLLPTLTAGDVTVLVPIDDGFARQPGGSAPILGAEAALRSRVLRYHLIPGRHSLAALLAAGDMASSEGSTLDFRRDARGLPTVNDARVLAPDIETANGVIHVVEGPLLEHLLIAERLQLIPQASRARSALASAGLLGPLSEPGPYTFFVPTDGAFTALGPNVFNPLLSDQQGDLLPRFLRHHIAPGVIAADAFEQGASFSSLDDGNTIEVRVDTTGAPLLDGAPPGDFLDLRAANGILHLMDGVLIPDVDVVDRMFLAGYTRFLDLVDIAGLEEELRTGGPYTVVPPLNLFGFYFDPRNDCYAEVAVLSHVGEGAVRLSQSPLGVGFSDLAGGTVSLYYVDEGVAEASRSQGNNSRTTPVRSLELEATNGVVYGVQDYLSFLPDMRPPC